MAGVVVLALLGGLTALLILRRDRRRKVASLVRLSCKADSSTQSTTPEARAVSYQPYACATIMQPICIGSPADLCSVPAVSRPPRSMASQKLTVLACLSLL